MNFILDETKPKVIYDLLCGLVAPRPIALVTSMDVSGEVDAAPFSAYNYLCSDPPILAIGVMNQPGGGALLKRTAVNTRQNPEFVVNVVTEDLAQQMTICSMEFPERWSKLPSAGLDLAASSVVKVPRLKQAHAALECVVYLTIGVGQGNILLGQVVSIFVEDQFVDPSGPFVLARDLQAIGRMNGLGEYVRTRDAFLSIPRLTYAEWSAAKPVPAPDTHSP